jgi:hypothetical protein
MDLGGFSQPQVIVKHVEPKVANRHENRNFDEISHARKLRSYSVEKTWYEQYAIECGTDCRIPSNYGLFEQGNHWVFVLEDLDLAGFTRRVTSPNHAEVQAVLRWLAAFHATYLGRDGQGLWPCGSYWHLGTRRNELPRITDGYLRKSATLFDLRLNESTYKTLVHGDAKIDNFCFLDPTYDPNEKTQSPSSVAAVDFQYVGGGCGMRDIAYFFSSVWRPEECNALAEEALEYYFEQLTSFLKHLQPLIDPAKVREDWEPLYAFAWADFYRFLCGWAPGHYDDDPYAKSMVRRALASIEP